LGVHAAAADAGVCWIRGFWDGDDVRCTVYLYAWGPWSGRGPGCGVGDKVDVMVRTGWRIQDVGSISSSYADAEPWIRHLMKMLEPIDHSMPCQLSIP
jgi:hypothetical protein